MEAFRLISMADFVIRKYKDELVHSGENWRDFLSIKPNPTIATMHC
jgi:hypothetical protein